MDPDVAVAARRGRDRHRDRRHGGHRDHREHEDAFAIVYEEDPNASTSTGTSTSTIRLSGTLQMENASAIWRQLRHVAGENARKKTSSSLHSVTIDLSGAKEMDGGVLSLLTALRVDLGARGVRSSITGTPKQFESLVELYELNEDVEEQQQQQQPPPLQQTEVETEPKEDNELPRTPTRRRSLRQPPKGFVEHVGSATTNAFRELKNVITFFGQMVLAAMGLARSPRSGHWREVPPLIEKTGADAIPIVVVINLLIGFVMAYQSSRQFKLYGANLYVADLVGISVTRELAPLMTAIIVCGRSGAAFAAEIGSMKVSEEIDALRTLGLRPFAWLVVPRVIALLVIVPSLTIIGDIVGILGGAIVAVTSLDLSLHGYLIETQKSVELWDVEHGLIKSVVFALALALIACQQGFSASGGAEGVGRRTTSTVVISLFALVLFDALLTMTFRALGR